MKKFVSLLLAAFLFTSAFSQDEEQTVGASSGPFSPSPFSSMARTPYCSKCRLRHRSACDLSTPAPTPVPFDGGLSVLLMAGAAYGVKRVRGRRVTKK